MNYSELVIVDTDGTKYFPHRDNIPKLSVEGWEKAQTLWTEEVLLHVDAIEAGVEAERNAPESLSAYKIELDNRLRRASEEYVTKKPDGSGRYDPAFKSLLESQKRRGKNNKLDSVDDWINDHVAQLHGALYASIMTATTAAELDAIAQSLNYSYFEENLETTDPKVGLI